jgi:hypothetical protein
LAIAFDLQSLMSGCTPDQSAPVEDELLLVSSSSDWTQAHLASPVAPEGQGTMATCPDEVQFQWTLRRNVGWQWLDMKPPPPPLPLWAFDPDGMSDTMTSTSGKKSLPSTNQAGSMKTMSERGALWNLKKEEEKSR